MIDKGSKVKIHYTLTVEGSVVDSSAGGEPLEFVQGEGQIIPGLESALSLLSQGDKQKVTVAPENAYGVFHPELIQKVPKAAFGDVTGMQVGSMVRGEGPQGQFTAIVKEIGATEIALDLNHPLAGKTLEFDVEVVGVVSAAASKIIRP